MVRLKADSATVWKPGRTIVSGPAQGSESQSLSVLPALFRSSWIGARNRPSWRRTRRGRPTRSPAIPQLVQAGGSRQRAFADPRRSGQDFRQVFKACCVTESASRRIGPPSATAVSSGWVRLRLSGTASDNIAHQRIRKRESNGTCWLATFTSRASKGTYQRNHVGHDHQLREFLAQIGIGAGNKIVEQLLRGLFPLRRAEIVGAGLPWFAS